MAPPRKKSSEPTPSPVPAASPAPIAPSEKAHITEEPEQRYSRQRNEIPPTEDPYDRYLLNLAAMPIRGEALRGTGLTPQDVRARAEADPEFSLKLSQAWDIGIDVAEDAAFQRGVLGWDIPIFTKDGGLAGYERRFDGGLLKEVLKANRAKYRGEDAGRARGVSDEARREASQIFSEAGSLP